jgi:predicted phage baseplate assembly protein
VPFLPPSLDDRSYDDLVQDMLGSIRAHTPEWTNPQPGDPGRTLIELFAWLADTILYRANLIPEKQRIAFLKLLGQSMQPAAAATGLVSLSLDPSSLTPVGIVAPARIAGAVPFETLGEIDLLPMTAQAYIKAPLTPDQQTASMPLLSGLQKLYKLATLPAGYSTTALFANNNADPNGIDVVNGTTDQSIWLALLVAKTENLPVIQKSIGGANGQQILNIGFVPSLSVPGLFSDIGPAAAVQATWQMSQPAVAGQPNAYTTLKVLGDTTQGLTQPGIIQLMVPPSANIGAPSNDVRADSQAGVGMKPPRIDDTAVAARLLTWVRLSAQTSLQVSWLGINAVQIDQRATYNSIVIGVSDGSANQQFALSQTQVDPGTFLLEIDMPGLGFQLWQMTDDLSVLQGPVAAFTLDSEAGLVTFGNQLQGMIPPTGRRIRVRTMRTGGGAAGNLPAGSLTSIQAFDASGNQVTQTITVQQPIPTSGGANSETLDHAQQRIPGLLRHQDRAVTASDYTSLVQQIPGANIGRVEVLPLFQPQTRATNVPGVVSVMVIPGKGGVLNPCPRADRPLLETVYQYLDPRRPVAAEMYVVASEYVGLGIAVAVEVKTGYGLLQVSQAVETALRAYLWPITPGGPEETGWPLGRVVRSLELDVIVSQVPGVIEVNGLNLFRPLASGGYQQLNIDTSGQSELILESWQLPEVLEVIVVAGPDGSGIDAPTSLTPPTEPDPTVAVPIVPAVC